MQLQASREFDDHKIWVEVMIQWTKIHPETLVAIAALHSPRIAQNLEPPLPQHPLLRYHSLQTTATPSPLELVESAWEEGVFPAV